jgi:ABC-type glutathione transport system ATPase component
MSEHALELVIQHRILESLAFEGMYGRYETVDDAHYKTLRWVFNDDTDYEEDAEEYEDKEDAEEYEDKEDAGAEADSEDEDEDDYENVSNASTEEADEYQVNYKAEDEAKTVARESLLTWMSSGAGIFHVLGKLGSGKSTLMKYLCDHASTKQLLEQWAGKTFSRQLRFHLKFKGSRANN